ncbi:hypothetical protein [Anabaena sp. CCY 9910]|uniref:hypothetical protein n=1 Tax=Anabaena sp. CCY 9910 TaxID=3103870 RepID=UPI0039E03B03
MGSRIEQSVRRAEARRVIPIRKKNGTNKPSVETRFIASSSPKDVLQSLIELVLGENYWRV